MQRVKIITSHKDYKVGQVVSVDNNTAHFLVDRGYGMISKDMTTNDYEVNSGNTKQLGVDQRSRRKRNARH